MLKKSRVDGKWPDGHFLKSDSQPQAGTRVPRQIAKKKSQNFRTRDVAFLRLTLKHGSKKIDAKKYPSSLSRAPLIFQNFIQRARQLSGTAIELARQQVVFLFQDVIFVGDIQRGQNGQA